MTLHQAIGLVTAALSVALSSAAMYISTRRYKRVKGDLDALRAQNAIELSEAQTRHQIHWHVRSGYSALLSTIEDESDPTEYREGPR